jgi:hypothetical protein
MSPYDTAVFGQIAFVSIVSIAALCGIGVSVHAYITRAKRRAMGAPRADARLAGDDDRLQRLEQAVDAIAVEVERISEGQRFLTKLQTDRGEDRALKG